MYRCAYGPGRVGAGMLSTVVSDEYLGSKVIYMYFFLVIFGYTLTYHFTITHTTIPVKLYFWLSFIKKQAPFLQSL